MGTVFIEKVVVVVFVACPLMGVFLFFMDFLLSNILITSGREKINTWKLVVATACNILLNLVFIPQYGAEGAAWLTVFCEDIFVAVMSLQVRKAIC